MKRSNMDGTLSLEMPIPSSFTAIETNCPLSITIKVIDLLSGVYLKALESKLKIIFSNLSLSIHKKQKATLSEEKNLYFFCCQQPEIIHYIMKHDNDIPVFNSQAHFFILYLSEIQYLINEQ